MATNGTSFEIDIDAPADNAEAAAAKVDLLATKLSAAGDASTAAANAVKASEAAYASAEKTADAAAKAVEKLGIASEAQRAKMMAAAEAGDEKAFLRASAALDKLRQRQEEAAEKAGATRVAMNDAATALDSARDAAVAAATEQTRLSKAFDATKVAAKAASEAEKQQAATLKVHADAAKKAADAVAKAQQRASGSGNFKDAAEGAKKLGGPLGKVAGFAGDAGEGLDKLSTSLGGMGLYVAGAVAVATALAAVSVAAIKGTASILMWGIGLADTGKQLDKLKKKFDTNVAKTFGGLKIDGLLGGLEKLVDLFDESTITGRAMKVVFESLFQPLVDGLTALTPKIIAAFIQLEIWVLKALIAIKPFGSTIVTVAKVVGVALLAVVAVIGIVVGFIFTMAAAAATLVIGIGYLGFKLFELAKQGLEFGATLIGGVGKAFDWVREKVNSVVEFLSGLSLAEIGTMLITGLAQGIMGGGASVLSAITGVVDGAIGAAKSALGIASPSKVFTEIGANTAAGMAGGVESGTGEVQGSMESMVAPPADVAGTAGGGGGGTYHLTFQISGGDAQANAKAALDQFVDFLESIGVQAGTEAPA